MPDWLPSWQTVSLVAGAVGTAIVGLYWDRIKERFHPLVDRHLDWVTRRVLRREPRPRPVRSHRLPNPRTYRDVTEHAFNVPLTVGPQRQATDVSLTVRWRWRRDRQDIRSWELVCPRCQNASLRLTAGGRFHDDVTLCCPACFYIAEFGGWDQGIDHYVRVLIGLWITSGKWMTPADEQEGASGPNGDATVA